MPLDITLPTDFYRAQLTANAVKTEPEDIAKFASAQNLPIHTAKLAKLFYEQLTLDGVKYANEDDRVKDAMKMASAYFEEVEEKSKAAALVADTALQKLAAVGEELLNDPAIKEAGLTLDDLFKVATLQLASKREFEAALTPKPSKTAALVPAISDLPRDFHLESGYQAPDSAARLAKHYMGYTGANPEQLVGQATGLDHADPEFAKHVHGIIETGHANPGMTLEAAAGKYKQGLPQGNFFSRNAKYLIPLGLLGAGGAYLLHRHNKAKEEERKQQLLSAMGRPGLG
jgi:hypothetical protein